MIDKSEENASLPPQSQNNLWKKWQQHKSASQIEKKTMQVLINVQVVNVHAHATYTRVPAHTTLDWGFMVSALAF